MKNLISARVTLSLCAFASLLASGSCSQAAPLVSNGDFAAPLAGNWVVGGKAKIEPRIVDAQVEGQPQLKKAIQLSLTSATGANPWDYWLKAPNSLVAIAKGDIIGVQFWARSTQNSTLNAVYQQSATPFEKTIRQVVNLQPQWQKFAYFAPAKGAYDAGASNFEMQLGLTSGDLEVTGVRVEDFGATTVEDAQRKMDAIASAAAPILAAAPVPAAAPAVPVVLRPRKAPPYVVLKLDDLGHTGNGDVPPRWKKVTDFCRERNIKCAIGIICNSLEGDNPKYTDWIKAQQASGLVEFWNHGYDHKEWKEGDKTLQEFKGPAYEQQKEHFVKSEALAREKLGFPLETFGAPFNTMDENTVKAIAEIPDIKVWLYADPKTPAGKVVLERPPWLGIENPIFMPSLERFVRPYSNAADLDCMVIQGHANMWDDARFDQFTKIVDFLTEQKAVFTTPMEYARLKKLLPN